VDWIAGVLYFEEHGVFDQRFLSYVAATSGWIQNLPRGDFRNDSISVYGQVGYAISARLRATAGLRYNEDGRQLTSRNAQEVAGIQTCRLDPAVRDSPDHCRATLPERRFDYVPYTFGLDFRLAPRALLYAKLSRGHRAGGYNLRGATETELGTFDPESVTSYEAGAKVDLFEDRLRLDLALFHSQFDDIQLVLRERLVPDAPAQLFVQNGGEARIDGGELEVTALLGALRLSGSLGIIDARFTRLAPGVVEVTPDSEFLNTPAATAALAADWSVPATAGAVDFHLDYAWRDDVPFAYDPRSLARQESYGLWNASVQARLPAPGLELSLWVRNLTDERYITRALAATAYINASPGDPRTYGITLRYTLDPG
jgi:iron complex outermembrane receptor protein